jgi:Bacterial Ig-like domain
MAGGTSPMSLAARGLLRAARLSLLVMALCPVCAAAANSPEVKIESPLSGRVVNNTTPSFSGQADPNGGEVTLRIYAGGVTTGAVVQELSTLLLSSGGGWSLGPTEPLKAGIYTAQAQQTNLSAETGSSSPVTFSVATAGSTAPSVTLNSPESASSNTTLYFTGTASSITPVTVQIHAGATSKGAIVSVATATGTGSGWTSNNASPALSTGQYTAVATQASSLLGQPDGRSEPVTFTVVPPPPTEPLSPTAIGPVAVSSHTPPVASLTWFPSVPQTGEPVSLVSTSTDADSPITGIAWALTSNGPFQGGGAVLTTAFSTQGAHVVRLRVTNAYGFSSVASEAIHVVGPTVPLMQPFPVVRIAGTETASGVKLKLLRVQQLPPGAWITLRCKGHGCPIKSVRRVAVSNTRGPSPVEFRLGRPVRFGVTLEILVYKSGEIGKYTRLVIRRGKLPERVDMCLDAAGAKPVVCPSS